MMMRLPLASAWMGVYQRGCVCRLLLSDEDVVDFDKSAITSEVVGDYEV
jgi:hypothetical protein